MILRLTAKRKIRVERAPTAIITVAGGVSTARSIRAATRAAQQPDVLVRRAAVEIAAASVFEEEGVEVQE